MARKGTELATAYYSLLPSLDGTAAAVNGQMGLVTAAGTKAGRTGGAALGAGLIGGLKVAGVVGAALGIAGIAKETTDYFSDAVGLASDLAESSNAVAVTYGDQADGIERLSKTASTRLGLSQRAFNDLATRFSGFASTIAGDGGSVVGVIDELTQRGADFASVFNLEVDEALGLFQSGLAGETEPLRRYGLDLSAATVEAYAYAAGIGVQGEALTEQQKVQARYGALLEQTSKVQGDFANTSDGLANSQRLANAQFEDAQARIGVALLPAAEKFSAWMLEEGVPLVERLVDTFIELEPTISAVADVILDILDLQLAFLGFWGDLFDALADGIVTTEELKEIFYGLPEPLQEAAIGFSQFLFDLIRGIYNFSADGLNGIIGFVNRILDSVRPLASFFGIQLPRLASFARMNYLDIGQSVNGVERTEFSGGSGGRIAMAEGAFVSARPGGVAATIGEGRYDEVVMPLSPMVLRELGEAIGRGSRPIYMDGSIVGVLRDVAGEEARLVLNGAVTELGFDMRAGGVAA